MSLLSSLVFLLYYFLESLDFVLRKPTARQRKLCVFAARTADRARMNRKQVFSARTNPPSDKSSTPVTIDPPAPLTHSSQSFYITNRHRCTNILCVYVWVKTPMVVRDERESGVVLFRAYVRRKRRLGNDT